MYAKVLADNNGKGVFQLATQTDDLARALIKAGRTGEALEWAKKLVRPYNNTIRILRFVKVNLDWPTSVPGEADSVRFVSGLCQVCVSFSLSHIWNSLS